MYYYGGYQGYGGYPMNTGYNSYGNGYGAAILLVIIIGSRAFDGNCNNNCKR